jgi:hypothetical protein
MVRCALEEGIMVIALAGRRVDAPGAETPRFPPANVAAVRGRIHDLLREQKAQAVVCSAACGADLLALETAGELGISRRIVLPYARDRFRATSVVDRPGDWGDRFDRILDEVEATGDLVVLGYVEGDEAAYLATNRAILDQAAVLAGQLQQAVGAVVVWDGATRGEDDITAAFAQEAHRRGLTVRHLLTL